MHPQNIYFFTRQLVQNIFSPLVLALRTIKSIIFILLRKIVFLARGRVSRRNQAIKTAEKVTQWPGEGGRCIRIKRNRLRAIRWLREQHHTEGDEIERL